MYLLFSLFIGLVSLFSTLSAQITTSPNSNYGSIPPGEGDNFNLQMQQEIQKAQQRVDKLARIATDQTRMPMMADKMALQNAMIMLEVKKTLVGNFQNTISVRSPLVRQALLNVLRKESISTGDLAELQAIVRQERPKVEAFDAAQRNEVTPAPSNTTGSTTNTGVTTGQ